MKKLKSKISWKYLLFLLFVIIGCSYQVIQIIDVYLQFETKIDVKYHDDVNEIAIPKLSLCKDTRLLMRNFSSTDYENIVGLSAAQLYDMTFSFKEIIMDFIYPSVKEFKDEEQGINARINYKKTKSLKRICYNFKYSNEYQKTAKNKMVYYLILYSQNDTYYTLHLSSDIDYKLERAKSLQVFGN